MTPYAKLETLFGRIDALEGACGILDWDARTIMPAGGSESRGEQIATLKGMGHDLLTGPGVAELVEAAAGDASLDEWARANLREMRRQYLRAAAVPRDLVEARERAANRSEMAWREARAKSDFSIFLPHLTEVLALTVRTGEAIGSALGLSPYDALLDGYDPGMRQDRVERIFGEIAPGLPDLIQAALDAQGTVPAPVAGRYPAEAQRGLGLALMRTLGFDLERGRLDVSLHPFCGGAVDDIRITTRYGEAEYLQPLMGILHETGHALYEQGLPARWRRQPVGKVRGMTLHESQSLAIEMQACRGRAFATFLAPLLDSHLATGPVDPDALHRSLTRVEPGLIRVEADEVTYPAHVLLRFDVETALVSGELSPDELPGAWDDGMRELLRVRVPDDRRGCLQDIHWSCGDFGYFPTYTLGAIAAAQLTAAARRALPGLDASIAAGDFAPLTGWMRKNVHARGSLLDTDALMEEATGAPLGASDYVRHLRDRYVDAR